MKENSPEQVLSRLARPDYSHDEMRTDIHYLLEREKRNAEIYEEALRHPDSRKRVEAAGVMIMQRQYNKELADHKDTKATLDILQEQHTNLQKWLRDNKINSLGVLQVMEALSPEDLGEYLEWKLKK